MNNVLQTSNEKAVKALYSSWSRPNLMTEPHGWIYTNLRDAT